MQLTCLIENRAPEGLLREHGLSLWIQYRNKTLLLDAGSTPRFAHNATALGLELSRVDAAVLSHGHYDHSGGFSALFAENPRIRVHICAGADGGQYADHGKGMEYIGLSPYLLSKHSNRFLPHSARTELFPGVWLLPNGVKQVERTSLRAGLYRKVERDYLPDDFSHEQTLVLEEEDGLVLFNSCSHAGVANIVEYVLSQFPGRRISAFVGGFHMMGPGGAETLGWTEEDVLAEASRLKNLPVGIYYTCHCTGLPAFSLLRQVLGTRLEYLQTGDHVVIE